MLADTIVAIATPPGSGAVAMVRLAGPAAFHIAARVTPGFDPLRAREARLLSPCDANGRVLDRALVTAFPAPHSFTGEDTVEWSTHGGALVPAQVLNACLAAGARLALPGEFTARAVRHGKVDLLQAEAIGDLIAATAPRQAEQALHQLDGGLSRRVGALREALLDAEALLAYAIDFPDEDDGPIDPVRPSAALAAIEALLAGLLATAPDGERVRRGALVVLAGPPNAGKSSLFNALLGRERALVTEVAGTTRDAIEADTTIAGWPLRLVDTAGLRTASDRLEQMGIEVSRRYLAQADLVLFCRSDEAPVPEDLFDRPVLQVWTKADLLPDVAAGTPDGAIRVSIQDGTGLARLRDALIAQLFATPRRSQGDEALVTSERQRLGLNAALAAVQAAQPQLVSGEVVLAAHELRQATAALDMLIGLVDREEVFARVFAGFCVGK